jgi:phospholipid N-methyltransferase
MPNSNIYRRQWDRYAAHWAEFATERHPDLAKKEGTWPGNEWGTEESWERIFRTMFQDFGVANWKHCAEIGPGAGKYTSFVLRNSACDIIAFDISPEYIKILCERLCQDIEAGRLHPVILEGQHASEMFEQIRERDLVRGLDAVYSIDAMVHVDLQFLMAYLVTAALTLKLGGHLILTLPNALSSAGFESLLKGIVRFYPMQGQPSAKFEWLSVDLIRGLLERLGFKVNFVVPHPGGDLSVSRDMHVVAELSGTSGQESLAQSLGVSL